jgi:uncharacterized peroxidase-related enzyme
MRAVSRFGVPGLDELPEDVRGRIEAVAERTGFVPNVFLALARRPAEFRAFLAYHDALMDKETPGLSKADREMIVVATSAANDCTYCVVAHGAILRIRAKDPLIADQVATNYRHADITPRQRAMLDFALRVATASATVEDEHLAELAHHGFDLDDVGHRRDCCAVRAVQPDGALDGAAAEPRVLPARSGAAGPIETGYCVGAVHRLGGRRGSPH